MSNHESFGQNPEISDSVLRHEDEGWVCVARFDDKKVPPCWDFTLIDGMGRVRGIYDDWLQSANDDEGVQAARDEMKQIVDQAIWDPMSM